MTVPILKFIHILGLVVWLGSIIFFTFISAPSIFKVLPKELAGDVVGDIFPKYDWIGLVSTPLLLVTLLWMGTIQGALANLRVPLGVILCLVICTYGSGLIVSKQARAIKMELRVTQDDTKKASLQKEFRKIHGISMILNLFNLIGGLILIGFSISYLKI